MAIDPGAKRVGVAISDPLRIVASPLTVLDAADAVEAIQRLCEEYDPDVVVVGLPVGLSGSEGPSALRARAFAERLRLELEVEVELFDERFTTRAAEGALLESGMKRRDRRQTVDKVAAAVILRHYLERA
jgi:putative Holliday junction resolvase